MPVVVVESPAKAKTIGKYLGKDYSILASYGHVRDLAAKDGSVNTGNRFEMTWEVGDSSRAHVKAISDAVRADNELYLATDPDREGEAISWHLRETLQKRRALRKDAVVKRVVFNAVTKDAVVEAFREPRDLDMDLVEAYLARRALDYLVGFNLSPVLWRKLPGAKSAGRVQSVCLKLIVERELEIRAFRQREYWSVSAKLATPRGDEYEARLTVLEGRRLDKFDIADEDAAGAAVQAVSSRQLFVDSVQSKPSRRNPPAPLMTSTLQQEASRKFGFGTRRTMSAAQKLYEAGLITYMRTDGIHMAPEAVSDARQVITESYGIDYLPKRPRTYRNKVKNAQEAHECIRPTSIADRPEKHRNRSPDEARIYDLVWKRTVASQMESARIERTTADVVSKDGAVGLRATGQVVLFDGFLRIYEEGRDADSSSEDQGRPDNEGNQRLPAIARGEAAEKRKVTPEQHFTKPPPRYTEAMLVKRMVELGIGRPSTYATIVSTIQERGYVHKDKAVLVPEVTGILVTAFLQNHFRRYVNYDYTAQLEEQLDAISSGREAYLDVLGNFWTDFSSAVEATSELRFSDVLDHINESLEPYIFPATDDGSDPRLCRNCGDGQLSLRTARGGGTFIGCSNYPDCRYTRPFDGSGRTDGESNGDRSLGQDADGKEITLRTGRFGPYVQKGEAGGGKDRPPRASVPKGISPDSVDLDLALGLLSLPRNLGEHPEGGLVEASIGKYGPFVVRHMPVENESQSPGKSYANLADPREVLTIGMNRAVELLAQKRPGRGRRSSELLRELGDHPTESGAVNVMRGPYGPYIKWNKTNVKIPDGTDPARVTLEDAVELIAAKPVRRRRRRPAAKRRK